MDWFKWLSSSKLDLSLVHQYDVVFTQNELQEDDIPFFNHEFLQSMGITIAKHRLEILKLLTPPPTKQKSTSRVLAAAKRTKKKFTKYMFKTWASTHREDRSQNNALAIVPVYDGISGKTDYDHHASRLRRGLNLLKRSSQRRMQESYYSYKKQSMRPKGVVNSSSPMYESTPRIGSSSSSSSFRKDSLHMEEDSMNVHDHVDDFDFDDGYWSAGVVETKWDFTLQNLKPT